MKARVLVSFVGTAGARKIRGVEGQIIDVPPGTDWVRAGLVEPLPGEAEEHPVRTAPETTAVEPGENAAMPAAGVRDGVISTESLRPRKRKG